MDLSTKNGRIASQDASASFWQQVFLLKQEAQNISNDSFQMKNLQINQNNIANRFMNHKQPQQLLNHNSDNNRNDPVVLSKLYRNRSTFHETRRLIIQPNLVSPPVKISQATSLNPNEEWNCHRRMSLENMSSNLFPMVLTSRELHLSPASNPSLIQGLIIKNNNYSNNNKNCNNQNQQQQQYFLPKTFSQNIISSNSSRTPTPVFHRPALRQHQLTPVALIDLRYQDKSRNRSLTSNSNNYSQSILPNHQTSLIQDIFPIEKAIHNDNNRNMNQNSWKQQSLKCSSHEIKLTGQKYLPDFEQTPQVRDSPSTHLAQQIEQKTQIVIDYRFTEPNHNSILFSQAAELMWSEKNLVWKDANSHKKLKSVCILPISYYQFKQNAQSLDNNYIKNSAKSNQIEESCSLRNYEEQKTTAKNTKIADEFQQKKNKDASQEQNRPRINNIQGQMGKPIYNLKRKIQDMIQTEIVDSCRSPGSFSNNMAISRQLQGGYNQLLRNEDFEAVNFNDNCKLYCTFSQQEEKKLIQNRRFTFSNSFWYSGKWEYDKPNGIGMIVDNSGQVIYEGGFLNGMLQGNGIFYNQNVQQISQMNPKDLRETQIYQVRQEGSFKDGSLSGFGLVTFSSGEKFIGEFQDDLPHGQGVFYSKQIVKGEWHKGVLIQNNSYK